MSENVFILSLYFLLLLVLISLLIFFGISYYWWKKRPVSSKIFKISKEEIEYTERMLWIFLVGFIVFHIFLTIFLLSPDITGIREEHRLLYIVVCICGSEVEIAYLMFFLGRLIGIKSTKVEEK